MKRAGSAASKREGRFGVAAALTHLDAELLFLLGNLNAVLLLDGKGADALVALGRVTLSEDDEELLRGRGMRQSRSAMEPIISPPRQHSPPPPSS